MTFSEAESFTCMLFAACCQEMPGTDTLQHKQLHAAYWGGCIYIVHGMLSVASWLQVNANKTSIYSPNFVLLQCLLLALYLQPADSLSKVLPNRLLCRHHVLCIAVYKGRAVVPDFVTRPEPDPLRDRSVLLGLLGQDPLDLEGFLRRLQQSKMDSDIITADLVEVDVAQ